MSSECLKVKFFHKTKVFEIDFLPSYFWKEKIKQIGNFKLMWTRISSRAFANRSSDALATAVGTETEPEKATVKRKKVPNKKKVKWKVHKKANDV